MNQQRMNKGQIQRLALRAMAGARVSLLLGRRRYTLTMAPIFRLQDGADGFLYLCAGLESLERRLDMLAVRLEGEAPENLTDLGGARGLKKPIGSPSLGGPPRGAEGGSVDPPSPKSYRAPGIRDHPAKP